MLSVGATIHKVIYPGVEGDSDRDVILGFDSAAGYDGTDNPFFWGTTGRFTNRFVLERIVTYYGPFIQHLLGLEMESLYLMDWSIN